MYCKGCGHELRDSASFCPNCGEPATIIAPVIYTVEPGVSQGTAAVTNPIKSGKKKFFIFGFLALAIIVLGAVIAYFFTNQPASAVTFSSSPFAAYQDGYFYYIGKDESSDFKPCIKKVDVNGKNDPEVLYTAIYQDYDDEEDIVALGISNNTLCFQKYKVLASNVVRYSLITMDLNGSNLKTVYSVELNGADEYQTYIDTFHISDSKIYFTLASRSFQHLDSAYTAEQELASLYGKGFELWSVDVDGNNVIKIASIEDGYSYASFHSDEGLFYTTILDSSGTKTSFIDYKAGETTLLSDTTGQGQGRYILGELDNILYTYQYNDTEDKYVVIATNIIDLTETTVYKGGLYEVYGVYNDHLYLTTMNPDTYEESLLSVSLTNGIQETLSYGSSTIDALRSSQQSANSAPKGINVDSLSEVAMTEKGMLYEGYQVSQSDSDSEDYFYVVGLLNENGIARTIEGPI